MADRFAADRFIYIYMKQSAADRSAIYMLQLIIYYLFWTKTNGKVRKSDSASDGDGDGRGDCLMVYI